MNPTDHHAFAGVAKLPEIVVPPDLIVKLALNVTLQGGLRYPETENVPVSAKAPA
jgi:hypothetical protein